MWLTPLTHPDSHIFKIQALETWLLFMFRRMKLPLLLKNGTGCTKQINWNKELKDALSDLIMKVLLLYFTMMRNGMRKRQRKQGIKLLRLISYRLFEQSKDYGGGFCWGVGRDGLGDYPRLYRSSFFFAKKIKRYLLSERYLSNPNIILLVLPKLNSCLYYFFCIFCCNCN